MAGSEDTGDVNYAIRLRQESFAFAAAHFITYDGDTCEPLHGHNYRVVVELGAPLDENAYVLDFIATRDAVQRIVDELDHRVLLPTEHRRISVVETGDEVVARFEDRRWVFPASDCRLLPVANTTAELLAAWIGERVLAATPGVVSALVEVEESPGQAAVWRWRPAGE